MQPEAIAEPVKRAANCKLRFRILGANERHHFGALLWRENVRHGPSDAGFVVLFVAAPEFLLKPLQDCPLIIQRRAANLLEKFNPRGLRK